MPKKVSKTPKPLKEFFVEYVPYSTRYKKVEATCPEHAMNIFEKHFAEELNAVDVVGAIEIK